MLDCCISGSIYFIEQGLKISQTLKKYNILYPINALDVNFSLFMSTVAITEFPHGTKVKFKAFCSKNYKWITCSVFYVHL